MAVKNILREILFASVLSGCAYAADSTVERSEYDYKCKPDFPSDSISAPYVEMLTDNPKIIDALDYCEQSKTFHDRLWEQIREAETSANSSAAPLPESFPSLDPEPYKIIITSKEAEEIYAAHIAHSLWLEKIRATSWRLADYNLEELKTLFDPHTWFWNWQPKEDNFTITYLLDHSPREAFTVLNKTIDLAGMPDQKTAILELTRQLRHFRHGDPGFCQDPDQIDTLKGMFEEKISRMGCQSMSAYFVSLAAAANIPGETVRGYYGGVGHRSAVFKFTGNVLAHGDDVYAHFLLNTPTEKIMDSYDFWEENVLTYEPFTGSDSELAYNSRAGYMENSLNHVSRHLTRVYCIEGRSFLDEFFEGYAATERLDSLESEIKNLTNDCVTYPQDNPDGTGSYLNMCAPPKN